MFFVCFVNFLFYFIIDRVDLAKQGDNALGSNKQHYQSKVIVCVSVISGCMQIVAQMRSIGF